MLTSEFSGNFYEIGKYIIPEYKILQNQKLRKLLEDYIQNLKNDYGGLESSDIAELRILEQLLEESKK